MAIILDGKALAEEQYKGIKTYASNLSRLPLSLHIITIGEDSASEVYVRQKTKAAERCGIKCVHHTFPANCLTFQVVEFIQTLNNDPEVTGIIVQLPIPKKLDTIKIIQAIDPMKDVDGLTYENIGRLEYNNGALAPCTAIGIMHMIRSYNIPTTGKNVVIVGRSHLVGKPLATMMTNANATVTLCHSHTKHLSSITKKADILVVAMGNPLFIDAAMVKKGATVIDVGINRVDGKLVGDVDFDSVKEQAGAITPVPGGVGPLTVAMLMTNVCNADHIRRK